MIGRRVSHFRVLEEIGRGGMGVVYKAFDEDLQRPVALKMLHPETLGADRRERFKREARAASSLNHPGIVVIHEVGRVDEADYIAMEMVEGRTLRRVIPETGLAIDRFLSYATQLAGALEAAHAAGVLHRDLKPGNVVVTDDGRVKVLDFGLAKRLDPGTAGPEDSTRDATFQTVEGAVVGTPRYMSPEQVHGAPLDARSDLFSLGAIFHEMLSGSPAFEGSTAAELKAAILRDPPRSLSDGRPDVPASFAHLVAKLLEKDPALRHQSAGEVFADLRRLQREAEPPDATSTSTSRNTLLFAAGFAAVALLAAAAWFGRDRRTPETSQLRFRLVSTFPGSHRSPSFSPDGSMIAFTDALDGVAQVWVKTLAGGAAVRITDLEAHARRPRWSPGGDQIVFVSDGSIWSVPPLGGEPTRMVEGGREPNFSRDGARVVYAKGAEIWTSDSNGANPRRVEGVASSYYSIFARRAPAFSPDGRWIVYFQPVRGPSGDLWLVPAAGGTPKRLTRDEKPAGAPVFTPDGRHVVFSSARAGAMNLWRVSADGGSPQPLTTGAGDDLEPDVSTDGNLVYSNVRNSYVLTLLDPRTADEREVLERRTVMALPVASPDGESIAFFGPVDDDVHIFTVRRDGSRLRQLTSGASREAIAPRWSADGQSVYYYDQGRAPAFKRIPADGGSAEVVVPGWVWTRENAAAVDASGGRVAYTLFDASIGAAATRVRDLTSADETDLSEALWTPQWESATSILGSSRNGFLTRCPVPQGTCTALGRGLYPRMAGERIFLRSGGRRLDDPDLISIDIASTRPDGTDRRIEATLGPLLSMAPSFDVSAAGELVFVRVRRGNAELWTASPELDAPE